MSFSIVSTFVVAAVLAAAGPAAASPALACPGTVNGQTLIFSNDDSTITQCFYTKAVSCAYDDAGGVFDSGTSDACPGNAYPITYGCPTSVSSHALITSVGDDSILQCLYGSTASCAYNVDAGDLNSGTSASCPDNAVQITFGCPASVGTHTLTGVVSSSPILQCLYSTISCAYDDAQGSLQSATSASCPDNAVTNLV